MSTTTTPAPPAELEPVTDATHRLVATFPLNGRTDTGLRIYIVNEYTDLERFAVADEYRHPLREFYNIANAVAYSLAGSGWGSHTIKEQVTR